MCTLIIYTVHNCVFSLVFQTCRKAERETADKINSCNKHNRPSVNCAGVATTPVKQNTTASSG